jgi:hypothetical protein
MWLESGLGLARLEPFLELAADRLAARQDGVVARAARRQLHEPHAVVTFSVTASVRSGLVQGPQAVALPLSPH